VTVDVIVEIAPTGLPARTLLDQPVGPLEKRLIGIAAPIFAAGAVKADVGGAPARPAWGYEAFEVVRDEADAVTVEERQDFLVVPALVTELDDLLEVFGQP
jgi:hypothetical protein